MSDSTTASSSQGRDSNAGMGGHEPHSVFCSATSGEAATIVSLPAVLLLIHFFVQPVVDAWPRLGYVRFAAARTAPARRIAPEPFVEHAWWWHELTRLTHALIHDPSGYHTHVVGNAALIIIAAWALLRLLTALGLRRWFVFLYWEIAVVAPIVGSFSFDLFGQTAHGYGASTVGYAFLGLVLVTGLFVLGDYARQWVGQRARSGRQLRSDGGSSLHPSAVLCLLIAVGGVVLSDLFAAAPATAVHQAGVGFGVLVGVVFMSIRGGSVLHDWLPVGRR
ncbi:hypothetical protein [Salinigranum marinum]|uniref:hypothetical protein n=1 Tax=Salinigranum marinum TaxID=1515595 RepID=UPI002989BB3C|nr:hypothetical protein [Salinigranum marinum]